MSARPSSRIPGVIRVVLAGVAAARRSPAAREGDRTTRLRLRAAVTLGIAAAALGPAGPAGGAILITNPYNFRDHHGPNPVGLPTGDLQQVGAFVSPSGSPTVVTATQGSTTLTLAHTPQPIFPDNYEVVTPFDMSLAGSWQITAVRGSESATVFTQPITSPQLLPFLDNLRVVGSGGQPTLMWEWPDLTGFEVDVVRLRIIDAATFAQINVVESSIAPIGPPGTTASYQVPAGLLAVGGSYYFRVSLFDLNSDGSTANRSVTYTQSPYTVVPEPTGLALACGAASILGLFARRRGRRA